MDGSSRIEERERGAPREHWALRPDAYFHPAVTARLKLEVPNNLHIEGQVLGHLILLAKEIS